MPALDPSLHSGRLSSRPVFFGCAQQGALTCWFKSNAQAGAFFVTRTKAGVRFNRLASRAVDKSTGVRSDHLVRLTLQRSAEHSPDRLRRVSYKDPETGKVLVFLTNNFDLPPLTIAQLYKCRWQVELFFKWQGHGFTVGYYLPSLCDLREVWLVCDAVARFQTG